MGYSLGDFSSRLPFYAQVGGISGAIEAGIVVRLQQSVVFSTTTDIMAAGTFAIVTVWVFILLLFGKWMRFTVAQIWLQSFVVVFTTGVIVTWVIDRFPSNHSVLLGFVVGVVVGYLFTWLCSLIKERRHKNEA